MPSDKSFGYFFALIFLALGIIFFRYEQTVAATLCFSMSLVFFCLAKLSPRFLSIPNRLWYLLGVQLSRITLPVLVGLLFFFVVTPFALVSRGLKRDVLRRRRSHRKTYWVVAEQPEELASRFDKQF